MLSFKYNYRNQEFQITENSSEYLIISDSVDIDRVFNFQTADLDYPADLHDILDMALASWEGELFNPFFWGADEYEWLNSIRGVDHIVVEATNIKIWFRHSISSLAAYGSFINCGLDDRYNLLMNNKDYTLYITEQETERDSELRYQGVR
jgi:hypothetical protein